MVSSCSAEVSLASIQVPGDIELPEEPTTVVLDGFSHQHILRDLDRKFNDSNEYD